MPWAAPPGAALFLSRRGSAGGPSPWTAVAAAFAWARIGTRGARPQRPPSGLRLPASHWLSSASGLLLSCSRRRPAIRNVLLISIDTLRADHLGAYGFPRPTTPNIDALAREGVLFKSVHTPGAHDAARPRLDAHGNPSLHPRPARQPARIGCPRRAHPGRDAQGQGLRDRGHRQLVRSRSTTSARARASTATTTASRPSTRSATQQAQGRRGRSRGGGVAGCAQGPSLSSSWSTSTILTTPTQPPEPFATEWREEPYAGEVAFADHYVGQVLEKLRQLGLYDQTLVAITGDHGEMLGEHGELNHGFFIYEGALRVPLIVRVPGAPAGGAAGRPSREPHRRRPYHRLARRGRGPERPGRGSLALAGGTRIRRRRKGPLRRNGDPHPLLRHRARCSASSWTAGSTSRRSRPELYDLRNDPAESVNLLAREPARADALRAEPRHDPGGGGPGSRPGSGVGGTGRSVPAATGRPRLPGRKRRRLLPWLRSQQGRRQGPDRVLPKGPAAQRARGAEELPRGPRPLCGDASRAAQGSRIAICRCPRSPRPRETSTRP